MNASAPASSVPPPVVRVLIAAHLEAAERAELAGHPEVRVEEEAGAILRATSERFAMVLLDLQMADVAEVWKRVAKGSAPVLVYPRPGLEAIVDRLRQALSEGPAEWQATVGRLASPETVPTRRRSRLVRDRSPEEAARLKRRALEASFAERARLLQDSLTTAEVAQLLRVSRQTPHDRVKAKTLLALEGEGVLRFPPWQFDAGGSRGVVEGLPEVLRVLEVGPMAQARWLTQPNRVLEGRSPLEALRAGEIERVVSEARGVGASAGHG